MISINESTNIIVSTRQNLFNGICYHSIYFKIIPPIEIFANTNIKKKRKYFWCSTEMRINYEFSFKFVFLHCIHEEKRIKSKGLRNHGKNNRGVEFFSFSLGFTFDIVSHLSTHFIYFSLPLSWLIRVSQSVIAKK